MANSAAESFPTGFGRRWGHHAPQLLSGSIVAVILLAFRPGEVGPSTLILTAGLLGFVLATWLKLREHDRHLCEQCVGSLPLDAAAHAARYRTRLRVAHAGGNWRVVGPYLAVLVATNFLTSTGGRLLWAVAQSSMIYLILSYSTHRTLQPWCPWCSDGGGGDSVPDTDPDRPRGNSRLPV